MNKRQEAPLKAYCFLQNCARSRRTFDIEQLMAATGWKEQTARTYISKRWKEYLIFVDGAGSRRFQVVDGFSQINQSRFLEEFTQVLSDHRQNVPAPGSLTAAKTQAVTALRHYIVLLGKSGDNVKALRLSRVIDEL